MFFSKKNGIKEITKTISGHTSLCRDGDIRGFQRSTFPYQEKLSSLTFQEENDALITSKNCRDCSPNCHSIEPILLPILSVTKTGGNLAHSAVQFLRRKLRLSGKEKKNIPSGSSGVDHVLVVIISYFTMFYDAMIYLFG